MLNQPDDNNEVASVQEGTANLLEAMGDVFIGPIDRNTESIDEHTTALRSLTAAMQQRFQQLNTTKWVLFLAVAAIVLSGLIVVAQAIGQKRDTDARNARGICTQTVDANWKAIFGESALALNPQARQAKGLPPATPEETLTALESFEHASTLSRRVPEICLGEDPDPTPLDR